VVTGRYLRYSIVQVQLSVFEYKACDFRLTENSFPDLVKIEDEMVRPPKEVLADIFVVLTPFSDYRKPFSARAASDTVITPSGSARKLGRGRAQHQDSREIDVATLHSTSCVAVPNSKASPNS
jgi:hypothetical protein